MGRPLKNKLIYFQHDVNRGKTVMIMKSKFGNDGYAFWFGLLEMLGNSDGTYIDLKEIGSLDYLSAWCDVDTDRALDMLKVLSGLHSIDKSLYENDNAIWVQKYVDRLGHLHSRRKYTPVRPDGSSDTSDTSKNAPPKKSVSRESANVPKVVEKVGVSDSSSDTKAFDANFKVIEGAHPDFDVSRSYARFVEFNESKNRELTKSNWEWWWNEDLSRGKYKKEKDPNRMIKMECPRCDYMVGVKHSEKDKGYFCKDEKCESQLAYGNTLKHERSLYLKQA